MFLYSNPINNSFVGTWSRYRAKLRFKCRSRATYSILSFWCFLDAPKSRFVRYLTDNSTVRPIAQDRDNLDGLQLNLSTLKKTSTIFLAPTHATGSTSAATVSHRPRSPILIFSSYRLPGLKQPVSQYSQGISTFHFRLRNFSSNISRSMTDQAKASKGAVEQFNQKFLDASAQGNLEDLNALFGAVNINVKSDRGWTALMFAARNGHVPIISALIEKGCDTQVLNASGQTALDIAQFWNHNDAVSILSENKDSLLSNQTRNYYSLNPLYRASDLRKNAAALLSMKRNKSSKFVVFRNQKPFLLPPDDSVKKYRLAFFSCDDFNEENMDNFVVIFLGLETWDPSSSAWFAVELRDETCEVPSKVHPNGTFVTPFPATMMMEETHAGVFAEAHSILCWLDRYRFCPTCGSSQKVVDGGYKQVCSNESCSSHKGVHNTCYPRVDPSLIMLVVSPDKKMCLLGRQKRFPPKMYSCLAGFMEPGECIEDTCRREVEEESGVKVGRVDYHSSQPWPFPATLMLGCIAYARTDSLVIDKEELEEARWFPRAELAQMLAGKHHQGLFLPPKEAIAHQLIKSWAQDFT